MPIHAQVDADSRILKFAIVGDWTTDEMIRVTGEGVRAISGRQGYDVLCDLTRTGRPSTPDEIRQLVLLLADEGSALFGRHAAMVVANVTSYGMMRMLAVHAETIGIEVRIFGDIAEAMRFLRPGQAPATG